jgi:chorismate mutase/N-acetylglutamate synthase-like GNAT family acetyltransferase
MKKAEECETLQEIRACIDEIDCAVIEQLVLRKSFVESAAKFKKSVSEVKASDRVKAMMEARRTWAQEKGLNPDFIQSLFERIVAYFIKGETEHWLKKNKSDDTLIIIDAKVEDARAILSLQKRAFIQEAEKAGNNYDIPAMHQTLADMEEDFKQYSILKATIQSHIVGSVRARIIDGVCHIGRLVVEPIFQQKGYGAALMEAIEARFPQAREFELFTGEQSPENIRFYSKRGYVLIEHFADHYGFKLVRMRKA